MDYYAKGKRSLVYKEGNVIIKVEKPGIQAVGRIQNEAKWLKKLNKYGIGPTFYKREKNMLYMEFIDGILILEYVKTASKKKFKKVLLDLLDQCRTLDKLKVNKYEMHHPLKHVIVRKDTPVLIDFERCKNTLKPKNVTQLCQFYSNKFGATSLLEKARIYKQTYSENAYLEIVTCLINTI
jgi:putative serine/threonine protein kinase